MKKVLFVMTIALSMATFACSNSAEKPSNTTEDNIGISQQQGKSQNVNVDEFKKLTIEDKGTILDVRTPGEWAGGIIEGAKKINFFDKNFSEQVGQLDKAKPVYVYCKSGGRSGKAASQLSKMGYTVYNLSGGIGAWNSKGYKTVK